MHVSRRGGVSWGPFAVLLASPFLVLYWAVIFYWRFTVAICRGAAAVGRGIRRFAR